MVFDHCCNQNVEVVKKLLGELIWRAGCKKATKSIYENDANEDVNLQKVKDHFAKMPIKT